MNTESIKLNELDMEKVAELKKKGLGFKGVSKAEYESYTPHQRYHLAQGNCCSLDELDEQYGVKTDIPDMEEFEKEYYEHAKRVSDVVLKVMEAEGCFEYLKEE